ncbi:MFS transporter [Paraglaciecola sp.]|uniref:MFS transporter n=1 Tax=Paraglaciecola sp. TaxID=1920173 RepID=UPI003EF5A918
MSSTTQITSSKLFIILSVLTGLVGAFIHPLMSYFLVEEVKVPPMYIGVYMVAVTLAGLLISQILGGLADKGYSARKMYVIANLGIVLALSVYINSAVFAVILFAGICFMAFGNASVPQMLTLSRQWADGRSIDITQFNARIRAGISVAWMIGPPIAFSLLAVVGFSGVFGMAILFAVLGILFVYKFIPEKPLAVKATIENITSKPPISFWCLVLAIVMASMGNNMYTASLPLYTIKELNLPSYTPGVLMGFVASLEIPIMLFCNRLCRVFKKKDLLIVSFLSGLIFYAGAFQAETFWQLACLQIFNAIFYGLFGGLGLTLMQEELPSRIGFTSAVYSNAFKIGVMVGATCTGFIAQFFSFQYALIGAMSAALVAVLLMVAFSYLKRTGPCLT